jgi:hypothetical protein
MDCTTSMSSSNLAFPRIILEKYRSEFFVKFPPIIRQLICQVLVNAIMDPNTTAVYKKIKIDGIPPAHHTIILFHIHLKPNGFDP